MDDSPGVITAICIAPSASKDHSDINLYNPMHSSPFVDNSTIDPQLLMEPLSVSMWPAADVPHARPKVIASTGFSTNSHESANRVHTGIVQAIVPATQVIPSTPPHVPTQPDIDASTSPTANSPKSADHSRTGTMQVIIPVTHVIPPTPSHVPAQPDVAPSTSFTADSSVYHVSDDFAQVNIPVTHVIPLTPTHIPPLPTTTDIGTHAVPVPDDFNPPPQSSDSGDGPSTPTSGRQTATVNTVLTAAYKQLEDVVTNMVEQTSLTAQQVLDGWHKAMVVW